MFSFCRLTADQRHVDSRKSIFKIRNLQDISSWEEHLTTTIGLTVKGISTRVFSKLQMPRGLPGRMFKFLIDRCSNLVSNISIFGLPYNFDRRIDEVSFETTSANAF